MDVWSSIVLMVNILLFLAGWLLFQQAKSDLTARAAQVPVLSEVKALQKSIAALLEQLKLESAQMSAQLEARCLEARNLLAALERRLEEAEETKSSPRIRASRRDIPPSEAAAGRGLRPAGDAGTVRTTSPRHQEVYALADEGLTPAAIAQRTGFSEGEVELILGLRRQAS